MFNEQYRYELTKQHLEQERCLASERRLARDARRSRSTDVESDGWQTWGVLFNASAAFFL